MRKSRTLASLAGAMLIVSGLAACTTGLPVPNLTASGSPSVSPGTSVQPSGSVSASATAVPAPSATPAPEPSYTCAETQDWTTAQVPATGQPAGSPVAGPVIDVRVGRHACYDRIVFEVQATADLSYVVKYVDLVHADPSNTPVPVPGTAVLQVLILAPWNQAKPLPAGADVVAPAQFESLASLTGARFAGSFENHTTLAVGTSSKLAFRVTIWKTAGLNRVIIDVAHPPAP